MNLKGFLKKFLALTVVMMLVVFTRPVFSEPFLTPANQFSFTYQVRVNAIPKDANDVKIWVPLAHSDNYQKVLDLKIKSPYPYQIFEETQYGNKILYLSFVKPTDEKLEFEVQYDVTVQGEQRTYEDLKKMGLSNERVNEARDKMQLYLSSQKLLVITDKIREIAQQVTEGRATDLEKAKAIYDYVISYMKYDKTGEGWGKGSTVYACEVGKGNCTDFHSLFISVARAAGIPARFKIGAQIPANQPEGTIGYHCWAEFYLPDAGWIPVDTSEAWKHPELRDFYFGSHDPGKFYLSLGRDIELNPAQKGEPINIFLQPYIEINGKPFDSAQSQFYFKNKTTSSSETVF